MENNQPKKKNAGLTALIALLLIITTIASCIGIYAWAKYISSQDGNATASIAKWSFDLKLKNGPKNGSAQETAGPIDLADTIDFTHVKSGTIAPGTNGEFQVIVNTGDTETDVLYEVTIALANCPRNITFSRVDENNVTTVLSAGGASNERTRILNFSKYLKAKGTNGNENGKHVETITWNWPFELTTGEATDKTNWDLRDKQDTQYNETNNVNVSMTITAKGTEMESDPNAPAANSVQGLAQSGAIQRWDTINYNPGEGTTASINLPEGASIEGSKLAALNLPSGATLGGDTINASDATNWVVLDVNQTTGEVLIMPRNVPQVNLTLSGKDGYNHAIEALDAVAGIYKNPLYAESARSLTVEDVNKVEGHTPDGEEEEYSWNHRYGMNPTTLDITDTGSDSNKPSQTYTSTATTGWYSYPALSFNGACWLASRCVCLTSSDCYFNVRRLGGGSVNYSGLFGVISDGGTGDYSSSYPVVPVVSLKSNVQLNSESEFYTETATATTPVQEETAYVHHNWTIQ